MSIEALQQHAAAAPGVLHRATAPCFHVVCLLVRDDDERSTSDSAAGRGDTAPWKAAREALTSMIFLLHMHLPFEVTLARRRAADAAGAWPCMRACGWWLAALSERPGFCVMVGLSVMSTLALPR